LLRVARRYAETEAVRAIAAVLAVAAVVVLAALASVWVFGK
jgi:FlaG/FlaF family flagellin (archaellin)